MWDRMKQSRGLLASFCVLASFLSTTCSDPSVTPQDQPSEGIPRPQFLSSVFDSYVFLGFVPDDQGVNDTPAQSDLNAFTRADNVTGYIGVKWLWDDVDSWTGSGQTGDACALFDTDNPANGKADAAVCVRINNPGGNPAIVAQLASPLSPLMYSCGDNKADRCSQPANPASLGTSPAVTVCEVEKVNGDFIAGGDDGADVLAACSIPLAAIPNNPNSVLPNLLNVCSFPSGSPNSNPFDCVVTPGAGFIVIKKVTDPQDSKQIFSFTISPTPAGGAAHSINDNTGNVEQTGLISAAPASNYSVTEDTPLPTGWELDDAVCERQTTPTPTPTGDPSTTGVTGVSVTSGETTICTFTNKVVAPSITVVKTAGSETVDETGGNVSYTVVVTNNSAIDVTLTSLVDDIFLDLDGQGTCNKTSGSPTNPYGTIAPGGTYTCQFTGTIGAADVSAEPHVNKVIASATSAGGPATAEDTAKVEYGDVPPNISVTKEADVTTIQAVGGTSVSGFSPDQSFARGAGGGGGTTPVFAGDTCDDGLANDEPDQSDLNCFSRADNVAGRLWLRWSWDAITGFGGGQTGDGCALLDTDNNSKANFAFCVRITNPTPTTVGQLTPGSPLLYKCKDAGNSGEIDRCASKTSIEPLDASSICTVVMVSPDRLAGGEEGADTEATCDLRLADLGQAAGSADLLNVCSFPSGSPNSNPFDCVVTPAAGFLVITKSTTPANSNAYFGFRLRNAANTANATATNGDDEFAVQGGGISAAIPILPGTYALQELMPTGWSLDANGISCTRDGPTPIGTTSGSTQLGVTIVQGQVTTCSFDNSLVGSGTVTFTVTVTNNSLESVNLFSLEDNEDPDPGPGSYTTLSGVGTCNSAANPYGAIASGGTYVCTFTRNISGTPGTEHKDKVRAVGKDNELNADTKFSAVVTVTITQ